MFSEKSPLYNDAYKLASHYVHQVAPDIQAKHRNKIEELERKFQKYLLSVPEYNHLHHRLRDLEKLDKLIGSEDRLLETARREFEIGNDVEDIYP